MRSSANQLKQRQQQWSIKLLRIWFTTAGRMSHHAAADLAYRLFSTPIRYRPSAKETATLEGSEPFTMPFHDRHLQAWRWGDGPPVLLVHGWAGRGSQLTPFVPALVAAGFSVIAYDAPAHGLSPGRRSSLVHFADAAHEFAKQRGPLHGVIAHSLGAASVMYAISRGASIHNVVLIGPPARPRDYVDHFGKLLGVPPEAMALMEQKVEQRFGLKWSDLDMPTLAREMAQPMLLIHDRDDDDALIEGGREIAANWPGATFIETAELGHRKILRDGSVVERAVAWLSRQRRHDSSAPPPSASA